MDKATKGCIGRGRGIHTNLPELKLIEQIKVRPLLYDKMSPNYRKSDVSEKAWTEVADTLLTSVSNCKKRWKSLRDTFIKYYRLEVMNCCEGSESRRHQQKVWNFYDDLKFLKPHVELFRLDSNGRDDEQITYVKESFIESSEEGRLYLLEEEDVEDRVASYEIKLADKDYESQLITEDNLTDGYEETNSNEQTEYVYDESQSNENEHTSYDVDSDEISEHREQRVTSPSNIIPNHEKLDIQKSPSPPNAPSPTVKTIVDPDERYLISCLPAFKRFTPQQKAYVRMGIEKLFYDVEFGDVCEPKSKKARTS